MLTWLRANVMTAAALVLAVLLGLQTWLRHSEQIAHRDLIAKVAQERAEQQRQIAQATERARQTEQTLADQAATLEATNNAEIHAARATADTLRRRLRDAAATRALMPAAAAATGIAGAAAGGDRTAVFEQIGDDLVSEAERADQLRAALAACTRQYNAARVALMQH